jgi:hypothetical protein
VALSEFSPVVNKVKARVQDIHLIPATLQPEEDEICLAFQITSDHHLG